MKQKYCNSRALWTAWAVIIVVLLCNIVRFHSDLVVVQDIGNADPTFDDEAAPIAPHDDIQMHGDTSASFTNNGTESISTNIPPPVIQSLIDFDTDKVIGDPSALLDYAIIGFPKCGTTAFAEWLSMHPQIKTFNKEVFALTNKTPEKLIYRLYIQLLLNKDMNNVTAAATMVEERPWHEFRRGYKNPLDIRAPHTLEYFRQLFPRTVLFVGIRHPVRWFESLYNFKVQNLPRNVYPGYWGEPNDLVDECYHWNETNCVGTAKGLFHIHLAALGKTTEVPPSWIEQHPLFLSSRGRIPNPIFLYESRQLSDSDTTRIHQLAADVQRVLGLDTPLSPTIPKTKLDIVSLRKRQQTRRNRYKIKICDAEYRPLRSSLMEIGRTSSEWIRHHFIAESDVHVSSREHFEELLLDWMEDPCGKMTDN